MHRLRRYFLQLPDIPGYRLYRLVLVQEIRSLLVSPALWGMLIIVSLLVGYSFIQAVNLFSRASSTALSFPDLASGMDPLAGIFVPTFGAYYLTQTLLLPFVAIRLIGLDKQSGALKLLLQLPLSPLMLCLLKITALAGFVCLGCAIPAVSTFILWYKLGGHMYPPEIIVLIAGHGLYSLTVISIAMFAATVSDSLPTAAMFCLAVTLGSWVLDFAAVGQGGFLGLLGGLSLVGMLRQFESGLVSSTHVISFLCLTFFFFSLTVIWLHPGCRFMGKLGKSCLAGILLTGILAGATRVPKYIDITEDQRHSFKPAESRALHKLDKLLTITINLDPQDSRLLDMERDVLAKLRRTVKNLKIDYARTKSTGLFVSNESDNYGLIEYEYDNRHDQSYSNSDREILPLIFGLAGIEADSDQESTSSGYPLVADAAGSKWWFYLLLPLFFLSAAIIYRKGKW